MSKASCSGKRAIFVDRFRAAHDLDRAVIELGRDARLALVLAPGDHPQARDQHHGRVGVAHGGRVRVLVLLVVGRVILHGIVPVLRCSFCLSAATSSLCGFHSTYSGLILVRRKWSGHDVPSSAQPWGVVAVDEAQDRLVFLHGADETLVLADLPTQPRQNLGEDPMTLCLVQRLDALTAKRLLATVARSMYRPHARSVRA